MSTEPRRWGAATWLASTLPLGVLGVLVWVHPVPEAVRAQSVPLTGPWRLWSEPWALESPPPSDGPAWQPLEVPGPCPSGETPLLERWLERSVDVPPALRGQDLTLRLGGVRSGEYDVRVDGHYLGREYAYGGANIWRLPRALVDERLTVVVRVRWGQVEDSGFDDDRWVLGPSEVVEPAFALGDGLQLFVRYGILFLSPFALVLLLVLRRNQVDPSRRRTYGWTAVSLVTFVVYEHMMTSNLVARLVGYDRLLAAFQLVLSAGAIGLAELTLSFLRDRHWLARATWWVALPTAGVSVVASAFGAASVVYGVYSLFMVAMLAVCVALIVELLRAGLSGRVPLAPVLVTGLSLFIGTAINDMLIEMHVLQTPRLMPTGVANLVIAITCVAVADFIALFDTNRALTRSLQTTNQELAVALVAAQESSRVKGEFVANVSHELRTPLNSIINVPAGLLDAFHRDLVARCSGCGGAFMPEGTVIDAKTACPDCGATGTLRAASEWRFQGEAAGTVARLQSMWRSGMQLLGLIDGVLDFSKIDAGRMTLRLGPVSARDVLLGVAATVSPIAEARKVRLSTRPPPEAVELRADAQRLSQALLNLASNALKFCPEGKTVELGAEVVGDRCRFWVRDEGIGIATKDQKLIFESFRQVDSSHTRKYGGTGIGLSIARTLVELHGGTISVESTAGEGALFRVEVPLAGPANAPTEAGAQVNRRVLVVADDPLAATGLRLTLQTLGHTVSQTNELEALPRLCAVVQPELVITDLVSPANTALAVKAATGASTKLVVLRPHPEERAELERSGAVLLEAPWLLEELGAHVKRLLGDQA